MSNYQCCVYSNDIPYEVQYRYDKGWNIMTVPGFEFTDEGVHAFVKSLRFCEPVVSNECIVTQDPIEVCARFEGDRSIEDAKNALKYHILSFLGRTYRTTRHVTNAYACIEEPATKALIAKMNYVTCGNYVHRDSSTRFLLLRNGEELHCEIRRAFKWIDGQSFYEATDGTLSLSKKDDGITVKIGDAVINFKRGGPKVLA